jgi:hypothetical protein
MPAATPAPSASPRPWFRAGGGVVAALVDAVDQLDQLAGPLRISPSGCISHRPSPHDQEIGKVKPRVGAAAKDEIPPVTERLTETRPFRNAFDRRANIHSP